MSRRCLRTRWPYLKEIARLVARRGPARRDEPDEREELNEKLLMNQMNKMNETNSSNGGQSMLSTANTTARARGAATQNRILERAVHIASVEGLSSMSLATLAKATAMSKSGLF